MIAPSLLAADFSKIGSEVTRAVAGGCRLDASRCDGRPFRGQHLLRPGDRANRRSGERHLPRCAPDDFPAGSLPPAIHRCRSDLITVHVEAEHDVSETLRRIRAAGFRPGSRSIPPRRIRAVEPFLDQIDLLLCMTVVPGFGGQAFMPEVLEKISAAAALRRDGKPCRSTSRWMAASTPSPPRRVTKPERTSSSPVPPPSARRTWPPPFTPSANA